MQFKTRLAAALCLRAATLFAQGHTTTPAGRAMPPAQHLYPLLFFKALSSRAAMLKMPPKTIKSSGLCAKLATFIQVKPLWRRQATEGLANEMAKFLLPFAVVKYNKQLFFYEG
jgi:hypothetical protein